MLHIMPVAHPQARSMAGSHPLIRPGALCMLLARPCHAPARQVDGRDGLPDVCVIELGGTVGDIESMPFVEALRQFHFRWEREEGAFDAVESSMLKRAVG